jgi:membrane-bound metal-dependent hydrolase YbcI (DUF457 family)
MPCTKEHLIAGLAVGGIVNGVIQWLECLDDPARQFDWGELVVCCAAGGAAALLPDILEPADSPDHRKFFHSVTAAGLMVYGMSGRHTDDYSESTRKILTVLGMGYLSHLALDCTTPRGIDLI